MKTIEQLYTELLSSEGMKKELAKAMKENKVEEFLKANGCNATVKEAVAFMKEKSKKQGEISDAELDSISGGSSAACDGAQSAVLSVFSVGISCAIFLAQGYDDSHCSEKVS